MIRFLSGLLSAIFLCAPNVAPCQSAQKAYHWYCAHAKNHVQPTIGTDLAFVEELDGYFLDRTHCDASAEDKVIYLTFDAGYENGNVEKILDILKEECVTGAFFILGHLITKNTDLVKRMAEEGHTVCNHTVSHKNMSAADDEAFLAELRELEEIYREQTGYEMAAYYRPPEGTFSRENLVCAKQNGYKTIFWSFAYPDWDNARQMSPEKAKQIVLENVHNGEVMLLHPTSSTNVSILADVIRELKSQGYRFGSLDELTGGGG
ncbi:MAG: polysaccharide deacetylase family protein [Clostridia bacterium]|nr:polysaccharide deacetylase family protein [Clostridia bacterium]